MPIDIDGLSFAGFPAFDSVGLKKLGHEGRIRWLRHRFQLVFGTPLEQFLRLERPDCYIWLCALTLMCAATEALSRFEFDGSDQDCFVEFVNKYFSDAFRHCALTLGPRPEAGAHRHRSGAGRTGASRSRPTRVSRGATPGRVPGVATGVFRCRDGGCGTCSRRRRRAG